MRMMEPSNFSISWNLCDSDWKDTIRAGLSRGIYTVVTSASAAIVGALFQKAVFPPLIEHVNRVEKVSQPIQEVFLQPLPLISKCKQDLSRCSCPPIVLHPPALTGVPLYLLPPLLGIALFLGYRLGSLASANAKPTLTNVPISTATTLTSDSGQSLSLAESGTTFELRRFADRVTVSSLSFERDKLASLISKINDSASSDEDIINKLTDAFKLIWNNRNNRGGLYIKISVIAATLQEVFNDQFSSWSKESLAEKICSILGPSHYAWWIKDSKENEKLLKTSYLPEFIVELSKFIQNPDSVVSQPELSDDE